MSFNKSMMLNYIVKIDVMSMLRMTEFLPSSVRAMMTTKVRTAITKSARKSVRRPNHAATPAWNWTARMFWFRIYLFPSMK